MKKYLIGGVLGSLLLIGCANTTQTPNSTKNQFNLDMTILKKYNIEKNQLQKIGNGYVFYLLNTDGKLKLYRLDKNYNLIGEKPINKLIDPKKLKVFENKIYLLGYEQNKNKPILMVFDKNGNDIKNIYYGVKFDTPVDFVVKNNNILVLLNNYNNGITNIKISTNNKTTLIQSINSENGAVITTFGKNYLVGGSIQNDSENALLICLNKNLTPIWHKDMDFGAQDSINQITINHDKILANVISQNYTGMMERWEIVLDKNGKIISKNKKLSIKDVPLRFK
jgi:hypothetical protein